jgi:DNA-binding MarR family transcriptional regulator
VRRADDRALLLDNQLCFALYRASRALTRAYAPILEPLGLTYPQYVVMLALWERDDVPVKDLGARLSLDSATLTPLLKRLEGDGVVARARDPEDERVVRVRVTPAGRRLRDRARSVPGAILCRTGYDPASPSSLADLGRLREALSALADAVEEPADAAG